MSRNTCRPGLLDPARFRPSLSGSARSQAYYLLPVTMSRPPRIPQDQYEASQRYFLTICTHNRREHFRDAAVVSVVLDQFIYSAREEHIAIPAYARCQTIFTWWSKVNLTTLI